MFSKIKKADVILLIVLVLLGAGLSLLSASAGSAGQQVEVSVDGQPYGTYSLSEDQIIEINDTNVCEIKDGEVNMIQADCPDQLCIHQGPIHIQGETIVCLPNRVVVEITGNDKDEQLDGVVQ